MAQVKNNLFTKGLSGTVGGTLVYRQMNGKTFVSIKGRNPQTESTAQRATRDNFREASKRAVAILKDPAKKAYYTYKARQMKVLNAYTAALTDCLRKPAVVRVKETRKNTGCMRIITEKKNFGIACVSLQLTDEQGNTLHAVNASREQGDAKRWKCRIPQTLAHKTAVIHMHVTDAVGNTITYAHTPIARAAA